MTLVGRVAKYRYIRGRARRIVSWADREMLGSHHLCERSSRRKTWTRSAKLSRLLRSPSPRMLGGCGWRGHSRPGQNQPQKRLSTGGNRTSVQIYSVVRRTQYKIPACSVPPWRTGKVSACTAADASPSPRVVCPRCTGTDYCVTTLYM